MNSHCSQIRNHADPHSDPHTASNWQCFPIAHAHLDWRVDFASKAISGSVILTCCNKNTLSSPLILDTAEALQVERVFLLTASACIECVWKRDSQLNAFSTALLITFPEGISLGVGERFNVKIFYRTTPECSALQWLEAAQTAGGKMPFLFSQCQAIHARSLVPCQDTPAVKFTYSASVAVPTAFTCLMSALGVRTEQCFNGTAGEECSTVFHFFQHTPIPSYLLALAVGRLESKSLSHRCALWSEPEVLQEAFHEFAQTETFLEKAEEIAGPYVWSKYDLLVLPPSFPYGGMENPCLTFVTPSLLAGDRSLVDVVAHEIAHSWTGNLVTASSNEHFWLNEGFTMFLERKILASIHGEAFRHFDAKLGLADLREAVEHFGAASELTKLVPDLKSTDPDDCFSTVPYEKGHSLLFTLEQLVGAEKFARYLRAHLKEFAYKSICTEEWLCFMRQFFAQDEHASAQLKAFDFDAWLYKAGELPSIPHYDDGELSKSCHQLCTLLVNCESEAEVEAAIEPFHALLAKQKMFLLDLILEKHCPMPAQRLRTLRVLFSSEKNVEVKFRWLLICLASKFDEGTFAEAGLFATQHGRMKYCRRIYRALYLCDAELAKSVFLKHSTFYHPIARTMIEKDLQIKACE